MAPLAALPQPPSALSAWTGATDKQRADWTAAYSDALTKAPDGDPSKVAPGNYGPVPALTNALLGMARSGALDRVLDGGTASGTAGGLDRTRTELLLGDGTYFKGLAADQHLTGDQWGMMNETGNYPGQSWLWLYSFWYQIPPFNGLANADLVVTGIMVVLTLALMFLPFIAGLRSIPGSSRSTGSSGGTTTGGADPGVGVCGPSGVQNDTTQAAQAPFRGQEPPELCRSARASQPMGWAWGDVRRVSASMSRTAPLSAEVAMAA
ncbi:hypothetical protein [Sinomonas atrocyanea]